MGERVLCKHEVIGSIPFASTSRCAGVYSRRSRVDECRFYKEAGAPRGSHDKGRFQRFVFLLREEGGPGRARAGVLDIVKRVCDRGDPKGSAAESTVGDHGGIGLGRSGPT